MKWLKLIWMALQLGNLAAQQSTTRVEQQFEQLVEREEADIDDDSYALLLEHFSRNPLDINQAGEEQLRELLMLSDLQIQQLLRYRMLFGKLIDVYELQAVPGWDIALIRKIIPLITFSSPQPVKEDLLARFKNGDHSVMLRISQVIERASGFQNGNTAGGFRGSPQKVFFRYRYVYKNLVQFGLVGEKDAGEQFFRGAQKMGFDFYSVHLFTRSLGRLKALAIGDFTVNMGQGLIHWQGLAFGKGTETATIKRQSAILRAYNSAGEFNFHRGLGASFQWNKVDASWFISSRRLNANYRADSSAGTAWVTSLLASGNNRTASEVDDRNRVHQWASGLSLGYRTARGRLGVNAIYHQFSLPIVKASEPYNLYAFNGDRWYNASIDYSYQVGSVHVFGEAAVDRIGHGALVNGFLLSLDPRIDLAILYRKLSARYQAISGNAFTENSNPSNESGFYCGIRFRLADGWQLDAYTDSYRFPWLRYRADAPGFGRDYLVQWSYVPHRRAEVYLRFRSEIKPLNQPVDVLVTNRPENVRRLSFRFHYNYTLSREVGLRNREEIVIVNREPGEKSMGFLGYFDLLYKPPLRPYSVQGRLQYFATDDYDSRLYAFENDVLYSYSIPVNYGEGFRYYLVGQWKFGATVSAWLRWSQSLFRDRASVGSGPDEIPGNRKSELKVQLLVHL